QLHTEFPKQDQRIFVKPLGGMEYRFTVGWVGPGLEEQACDAWPMMHSRHAIQRRNPELSIDDVRVRARGEQQSSAFVEASIARVVLAVERRIAQEEQGSSSGTPRFLVDAGGITNEPRNIFGVAERGGDVQARRREARVFRDDL